MSKGFVEVRKAYRRGTRSLDEQYLDALKKLLFPEDCETCQCVDKPKDKTKDPLYIGLVVALWQGTTYGKSNICKILDLTSEQYECIRAEAPRG